MATLVPGTDQSQVDGPDQDHFTVLRQLCAESKEALGRIRRIGGNPQAEFRLRKKRARAIWEQLEKIGPLACLGAGSLLVGLDQTDCVRPIERSTYWRTTLTESAVYSDIPEYSRGRFLHLPYDPYQRLESGIQSLCQVICLATRNLGDVSLLRSFYRLKLWAIAHGSLSPSCLDDVMLYLKWIGKACQAVLLQSKVPERPRNTPDLFNGAIAPFDGPLRFISDMILSGKRRAEQLTSTKARALAQVGNLPRALPYPSVEQIRVSVRDTVATFSGSYEPSADALKLHKVGMSAILSSIPKLDTKKTHVSLLASGSLESSRKEGGRAAVLVKPARKIADQELVPDMEQLVNRRDQFGLVVMDPGTWALAKSADFEGKTVRLGDLLYVGPDRFSAAKARVLESENRVPLGIGNLLNMTASRLIMAYGSYTIAPQMIFGVLTFDRSVKFRMERTLPVRASLSIEAGFKTRLVTMASAAFAHLSQLPANFMREYLSQDPFTRVGFEEADKLWEVLKAYRKRSLP